MLVVYFGLDGALIALVSNQSVIFFVVVWVIRKHKIICIDNFKKSFNKKEAIKLSSFASMSIVSSVLSPVSHLLIRSHLGETLGWKEAGYWQAIWYISSMYLMVVTTTLSIYYLPRLSEITSKNELKKELFSGYKIIMPIVIISCIAIYLLRDFIIQILFSEEFSEMSDLFLWQLIGDVIKIASWLLSYMMLAKAMTKIFIFSELFFTVLLLALSYFFTNTYGVVGMTYAHTLNYTIYLFFVLFVYRGYVKNG